MPVSTAPNSSLTWIDTQHKTFTRWCNVMLAKSNNPPMTDLVSGFHTGVNLVLVVQELTKSKKKYYADPKMRIQMIENIQVALDTLEKDSNIRLVNIGAQEICDGSLKIILGLVWTMISRFQGIPRPEAQGRERVASASRDKGKSVEFGSSAYGSSGNADFDAKRLALQKGLFSTFGSGQSGSGVDSATVGQVGTGKHTGSWDDPWGDQSGDQVGSGMMGSGVGSGVGSGRGSARDSATRGSGQSSLSVPQAIINETPTQRHQRFEKPFVQQPEYERPVDLSQKQEMVAWINYMTQTQIRNFTTDFSDGYILTRLIQRLQHDNNINPLLTVKPNHSYEERVRRALAAAKDIFNIPYLIDEEDLVYRPDELSTVTYLLCLRSTMEDFSAKSKKKSTVLSDAEMARQLQAQFDRESGSSSTYSAPSRSIPQSQPIRHKTPPRTTPVHSSSSAVYHPPQPRHVPDRTSPRQTSSSVRQPSSSSYRQPENTESDEELARKLQEQFNLEAQHDFESRSTYMNKPQQQPRRSSADSQSSRATTTRAPVQQAPPVRSAPPRSVPPPPMQQQQQPYYQPRSNPPQQPQQHIPYRVQPPPQQQAYQYPAYVDLPPLDNSDDYYDSNIQQNNVYYEEDVQPGYVTTRTTRYYSNNSNNGYVPDDVYDSANPFDLPPPPTTSRPFKPYGNRR